MCLFHASVTVDMFVSLANYSVASGSNLNYHCT